MSRKPRVFWGVALCVAALVAQAQVPRDYRAILALLQPAERARLEAQAAAWSGWTRAQRNAFRQRAARWAAQPLPELRERREHWQAWMALPAAERERLRAEAARLAQLPQSERDELRARFAALDATTQRGWMLGPVLGADYMRLQPLLAQVPPDQHAALVRTLRAMSPLQRVDLGVLLHRTPPARRNDLRRELISTSDANRDAWLQLNLER